MGGGGRRVPNWLVLDESARRHLGSPTTASGFEFGSTYSIGGDFAVAPNAAIGPFFAFTLAEYSHLGGTIDTDHRDEVDPRLDRWAAFAASSISVFDEPARCGYFFSR